MAYGAKQLYRDIEEMNARLKDKAQEFQFRVGARGGHTTLELLRPGRNGAGLVLRDLLKAGTPRECYNAACEHLASQYMATPREDDIPASLDYVRRELVALRAAISRSTNFRDDYGASLLSIALDKVSAAAGRSAFNR